MRNDDIDLGPCCACDGTENVRNIIQLNRRLGDDMIGSDLGWGCFTCGLPMDGAVAVVCDDCLESGRDIRYVRLGGSMAGRRVSVDSFPVVPFDHYLSGHRELWPKYNPYFSIEWLSVDNGLCCWCGQPFAEGDAPIVMWRNDGHEMVQFHKDGCWAEVQGGCIGLLRR